jgi:surfactin synthase thioesterase subunit
LCGSVDLQVACLPGQLDRNSEPAPAELREWGRGLASAIAALGDVPYALYGHSLGGLVAFETARELRRLGVKPPRALFVGAIHAPHLADPFPRGDDRLTDRDTLGRLGMLDNVSTLLADHALIAELRPIVQSGIERIAAYVCIDDHPLDCKLVALGGSHDQIVSAAHLEAWAMHTRAAFERIELSGGHLFHQERPLDTMRVVHKTLGLAQPLDAAVA